MGVDLITPAEQTRELLRLSRLLDAALEELTDKAVEWAKAKDTLRRAEARQYAEAKVYEKTETARKQFVTDRTMDEAFAVDMADALKNSASLAVRSRIAQLSAGQSVGSTIREELRLAGRAS